MRKKYVVELTEEERGHLLKLISSGEAPARMLNRARVLLKANQSEHADATSAPTDREIALMLETSTDTVQRVRERFSLGRGWTLRWSARCPIGSTRGPSTGGLRLG